jgi:hypothetical protein
MNSKFRLAIATLAAALTWSGARAADLAAPIEVPAEAKAADTLIGFSVFAAYFTDYNFRGISNSNQQGSLQSSFEVQYLNNSFYTRFSTEQVRLPTQPDFEFDLIAGVRPTIGKLALDLAFAYYFYPGEKRLFSVDATGTPFPITQGNSDYYEITGKATYPVTDALTVGANVYFTPNYFGTHAIGTYASGAAVYTLPASLFPFISEKYAGGFSLSAEAGYYTLGAAKTSATGPFNPATGTFPSLNLPSYAYGNVGLSYAYKNLLLDLRYHDSSLNRRDCFTITGDYRGFINGGTSRWCGAAIIGGVTWVLSTAAPGVYAEPNGILDFFK